MLGPSGKLLTANLFFEHEPAVLLTHVPYHLTWVAEKVEAAPQAEGRFFRLETLRELPGVVATLNRNTG